MGLFYQYWTQRKQIQESEYFTQELSLVINYSSRFVQYPHYPIACCLPHRTSTVAHNCHGKSTLTSRQKDFCRESFSFCREVILFAVRFFFLPWGFSFCSEVNSFAVTVAGHRTTYLWNSVPEDSRFFNMWVFVRTSTNFAYLTSF